ncbi:MAG: WXG100 family type VII secretion target [Acidimicrobiales bacterium]|nr:WXG100 family type VII secretion target [Acidimicrobiales bacterium]
MSEILLKADEARNAATDVKNSAGNAQSDIDALRTRLGALSDSFRGQSAIAWEDRFTEWDTSAKQLLEALDALGQFLNSAADTIEQTDQSIADQLRG